MCNSLFAGQHSFSDFICLSSTKAHWMCPLTHVLSEGANQHLQTQLDPAQKAGVLPGGYGKTTLLPLVPHAVTALGP